MNVALINPPSPDGSLFTREGRCTQRASLWATQWPPVTLAYLAAVLRDDGHEAYVYDCPATMTTQSVLIDELTRQQPRLCVMATSTPSLAGDMQTLAAIKRALPETATALIGVHATAMDADVLARYAQVDFIVRREPEATVCELAQALNNEQDASLVKGLSYRQGEQTVRNDDRPFLDELDALPFPAWELVDREPYRLPFSRRPFLCLVPQRGCSYRCSFCTAAAYYGRRLRKRSVASIIAEIKHDRERFGVDDFFMWAETFTLDRDFVFDLARAMQRETPGIRWTCNSRTDTVDEELLREMARAGCWMVSFGIESADDEVQRQSGKNLQSLDFAAPLRAARAAGIKTVGHFIFGLPGETQTSLNETLRLALSLDLDFAQFYAAAPFVGSALYDTAVAEGWLRRDDFAQIEQTRASLSLPGLPAAVVDRAVRRAKRRFYLRPRQVARLLGLAGFGIVRQLLHEMKTRWQRVMR